MSWKQSGSKVTTALVMAALSCGGCTTNGVRSDREMCTLSPADSLNLGEDNYVRLIQVLGGTYTADPELTAYVNTVGARLAASSRSHKTFRFTIVNNSTPNLWTLPSGSVGIHRGLLTELENEAELAALLAHGMAHNIVGDEEFNPEKLIAELGKTIADPVNTRAATMGTRFLQVRYDESKEAELDETAISILTDAGYDLDAAANLYIRLKKIHDEKRPKWCSGLLAYNPPTQKRINRYAACTNSGRTGYEAFGKRTARLRKQEDLYAQIDECHDALYGGRSEIAELLAKDGCRKLPNEYRFYWLLGKCHAQQGDHQEALTAFNRAQKLNPQYYATYIQRGLTYEALGNAKAAQQDLERSLTLLPTAEAHYQLARLHRDADEMDLCSQHLEEVAETGDSALALLAQEELLNLHLRQDPARFIGVQAFLDRKGYLNVSAVNKSIKPLRHIAIAIHVDDKENVYKADSVLKFEEPVQAGGRTVATFTGIGPFDDLKHLEQALTAEVVDARMAETAQTAM